VSCMEHHCRDCDREWFDNHARAACPHCGSVNVAHYFDERDEHDIEYGDDCYCDDYEEDER